MRRRKLLIGIGAAATGGTAAFGTEAFTSVQADRNVDVSVEGDASSYLALQAASNDNGRTYVRTESDDTLEIILDGDDQDGSGVPQDAITEFNDLFTILNQGSQPVNVYFEDDSDAVTFRSGSSSIEGSQNSVEVDVGEELVISLTVDTLNNEVGSGQILDVITVFATTEDPTPGVGSIGEFDRIVDTSLTEPDEEKFFADLTTALDNASEGDNIGLDNSIDLSSPVTVDTSGVTLAGRGGNKSINTNVFSVPDAAIRVTAPGVSIRDVSVQTDASEESGKDIAAGIRVEADDATVAGSTVSRNNVEDIDEYDQPSIYLINSDGSTVTNNSVTNGAIGVIESGNLTVTDNVIDGAVNEGIWFHDGGNTSSNEVNGSPDDTRVRNTDFDVVGNSVTGFDAEDSGTRAIKFVQQPDGINGEGDIQNQLDTLLAENDIDSALIKEEVGTKVSNDIDPNADFDDVQSAVDAADALTIVESGNYEGSITIDTEGLTLEAAAGASPTIDADSARYGVEIVSDNVTVRGFQVKEFKEIGIFDDKEEVTVTIEDNVVAEPQPDEGGATVQHIQLTGGDGSQVTNNTVNGIPEFEGDWASTGILAEGTNNAEIRDNNVNSNDIGIGISNFFSDVRNVDVKNNEVEGDQSIQIYDSGNNDIDTDSITISDNTLKSDNTFVQTFDLFSDEELSAILNDQGNTFEPAGTVNNGDGEIVPE